MYTLMISAIIILYTDHAACSNHIPETFVLELKLITLILSRAIGDRVARTTWPLCFSTSLGGMVEHVPNFRVPHHIVLRTIDRGSCEKENINFSSIVHRMENACMGRRLAFWKF